jgi:hypothetical protein
MDTGGGLGRARPGRPAELATRPRNVVPATCDLLSSNVTRPHPVPPVPDTHPTPSAATRGLVLAAVLLLALGLRLWGLHYGLPWLFYFHDEPQVVLRALRFGTGDPNPHFFVWPGTPLLYLAFLAYGGLFLIGRLAGWWAGKDGFAAAYFADPTPFYLLPRLQSVAIGTWAVALANGLGAAAYSAPVGVAAALGLALNQLHAHYSHFAHPVTWMAAFTWLGLWAAVRIATGGGRRDLVTGAVALGIGTACQYHAGLLAAPLGVAILIRAVTEPDARGAWLRRGLAVGAAGVALFLLLAPFTVLDFAGFRADLIYIAAKTEGSLYGGVSRGWLAGFDAYLRRCLVPALGAPLSIAAAGGFGTALFRRSRADLVLVAFVVAYLALASRAASLNDRYAIPLVVPALLLAARFTDTLLTGARLRISTSWTVPASVAVLCAPVALATIEDDYTMTRTDTRIEALRWFEANVPDGARVSVDMLRFWNTATAPIAEDRERLVQRIDEAEHGHVESGQTRAFADYYRYQLEHPHTPSYYVLSTNMGTAAPPLDSLRRRGFEWAMVNGEVVDRWRARPSPPDSSGGAYYRALDREATLVASFVPEAWARPGPVVRVYRLVPPGGPGR